MPATLATSLTVSAPTNADAHRLGVAIRQARRELGQVGPDRVTHQSGRAAAATSIEMAHRRRRQGAPVRLDAGGGRARQHRPQRLGADGAGGGRGRDAGEERQGAGGRIAWKTLADGAGRVRLAYGEVMTTHTAQGSTATEHIYALPSGSQAVTGFAAYSSGTRHRRASYLVISEGAEKAEVARRVR